MANLGAIAESAEGGVAPAPLTWLWYLKVGYSAGAQPQDLNESGVISGTVSVEGVVTEGVVVSLYFGERRIAQRRTDASGDYSFTHVVSSVDYTVVVSSPDPDTYNDQVFVLPGA